MNTTIIIIAALAAVIGMTTANIAFAGSSVSVSTGSGASASASATTMNDDHHHHDKKVIVIHNDIIKRIVVHPHITQKTIVQQQALEIFIPGIGFVVPFNCHLNSAGDRIICDFNKVS